MWFKSEKLLWSGFAVAMVGALLLDVAIITHDDIKAIAGGVLQLSGMALTVIALAMGLRGK